MWDEQKQEIWIQPGRIEKLMERTGILLVFLLFIGCNLGYDLLPTTIPLHIGTGGDGHNYASKAYFFVLPSIGILVYLGISMLNQVTRGHAIPPSAERQYRQVWRMLELVKMLVLVACTIEMGETVRLSYKELGRPGWYATIWEALFLLTPLVYYLVNLRRMRQGHGKSSGY